MAGRFGPGWSIGLLAGAAICFSTPLFSEVPSSGIETVPAEVASPTQISESTRGPGPMLGAAKLAAMSAPELSDLASQRRALFHAELDRLAEGCRTRGMTALEERIGGWAWLPDPGEICVPVLPDAVNTLELSPDEKATLPELDQRVQRRFYALRQAYAVELTAIARALVRKGASTQAMTLVFAAVRENPDDVRLRRILGQHAYQGAWRTAWEVTQMKAGMVDHPQFGWIGKRDVERYESGKRPLNGKWVSESDDAAAHATMDNGRFIESEHFRLRTSVSLEEGVVLLRRLEMFYAVWSQLFVGYSATPAEIAVMFGEKVGGSATSRSAAKLQVALFADREDYIRTLRPMAPMIEKSLGFYHAQTRHAYFFRGGDEECTIYHEATHQLFRERQRTSGNGPVYNFWMVEAIACYFETLREDAPSPGSGYTSASGDGMETENGTGLGVAGGRFRRLGGVDAPRMLAARLRLLEHHFYVPLRQLAMLDSEQFQQHPNAVQIYTQSAGLAQFFMHAQGGMYRDAFVDTLYDIYAGKGRADSLARAAGRSLEELDEEYRAYIDRIGVPEGLRMATP